MINFQFLHHLIPSIGTQLAIVFQFCVNISKCVYQFNLMGLFNLFSTIRRVFAQITRIEFAAFDKTGKMALIRVQCQEDLDLKLNFNREL